MFELGEEYLRKEILDIIGSRQAQTGVIWCQKESSAVVVISRGREAKNLGYNDEKLSDGQIERKEAELETRTR